MPAPRAPVGVARGRQAGSARSVAAVRGMCGVKGAVLQKKELLALSMRGGFKSKSNKYSMHRVWLLAQPSQVLGIDLNGLAPAQSHPGPPIEFISNGIELLLGVATQIGALWEVLAQ